MGVIMNENNTLIKQLHFYKAEEKLPNVFDYKEDFPFGDVEFIVHVRGFPYCTTAYFFDDTFVPTDRMTSSSSKLSQFMDVVDYWAPMIKWR